MSEKANRLELNKQKYKILTRLRANHYTSEDERNKDLLKLQAVISWIGPLVRTSRNNAEIETLLSQIKPVPPNPRYHSQALAYMSKLEKKGEPQQHKQTKKTKTRQMVMDATGGLVWRMV